MNDDDDDYVSCNRSEGIITSIEVLLSDIQTLRHYRT